MTAERDHNVAALRRLFKVLNRYLMVPLWRLGCGKALNMWPAVGGRIMVLVNTGRTSGNRYHTPVNYAEIDGDIYIISGFGTQAHWYKNVMAQPEVEIWLPGAWWRARAEDVSAAPNRLAILRAVLIASGLAAPVFEGLHPTTMTDDDLAAIIDRYRLLRLRRITPLTGDGGPGSYAWVWPLVALGLALLLVLRARRRA